MAEKYNACLRISYKREFYDLLGKGEVQIILNVFGSGYSHFTIWIKVSVAMANEQSNTNLFIPKWNLILDL